jgi:TolB-like protein/Tfp pilus assembly protein PilF
METRADSSGSVRFGTFELDLKARELRSGTTSIRLQEQPFEILRVMLERPGDVVTREELRDRLWPQGTFVDFEHSLNAAVKRLRAALGDDAEHPRFVETLPRRGYRFIAKLDLSGSSAPGPALRDHPLPAARLAVLPFSNLTDDGAQEYFSDGLTEEMIAQLGGLCGGRVGVLARWSSMVFKGSVQRAREIGEALRADYLLEGSVRREGDRVRITARLIEAAGETQLWSETYERSLTDCLLVQTEVAARIARSLALELTAGDRAEPARPDPFAYQAYLKGRYHWNTPGDEGLDQAIAFYQQAIASAPRFGAAHAALARARLARAEYYRELPRQAILAARADASRAVEIDSTLYEAHMVLGDAARMLEWNWAAADASYARAIALNPSYETAHRSYALMLTALGRHDQAVRESARACELDPLCLVVGTTAAWVHFAAGDYRTAIGHCRNTLDMGPHFMPARRLLGAACLQAGRDAQAIAELESAAASGSPDPVLLAWLAHAKAVTGATEEANALVARIHALAPGRHVPSYHLALAYVGLGDADAAFEALDRAWLDRDPAIANAAVEPRLRPLHGDARFRDLVARMRR